MANEKRLIDANEMKNNIMEAMMRQFEKNGDQIALRIAEMMWHFIDETDTVDAVEVVHGRWVMPTIINGRNFKIPHCSVCNEVPCGVSENTKYCAICGARMDLENTKNG